MRPPPSDLHALWPVCYRHSNLPQLPVNCTMSSSSRAPTLSMLPGSVVLDVALSEYRKNMDFLSPLAMELQCCDSIDGILAILQRQANTIEQLKDGNKGLTEWVTSSVNILLLFSGTLGDGVSLVRHGLRTRICVPSNVIVRRSHLRNRSLLESVSSSPSVSSSFLFVPPRFNHLTGGKGCEREPRCGP
jgi:hypothetical protein